VDYEKVIKKIKLLKKSENIEGMVRFGIRPKAKVYGVPIPEIRRLAKIILQSSAKDVNNHKLALKLWNSKIHEAKILASIIANPQRMTEGQANKWVNNFDSWDVCDQVCMNLFNRTKFAHKIVFTFVRRKDEFAKRAAFALMAALAFHDKKAKDKDFIKFFPLIKLSSTDERNFVKKAVNWALRQIGKRNIKLNEKAIKLAKEIIKIDSKSAKWIAKDALRELTCRAVQERLRKDQ